MVVASSQGGMDIESLAKTNPEAIRKFPIDIEQGMTREESERIVRALSFTDQSLGEAAEMLRNLYRLFLERDCTMVEINPMAETANHKRRTAACGFNRLSASSLHGRQNQL